MVGRAGQGCGGWANTHPCAHSSLAAYSFSQGSLTAGDDGQLLSLRSHHHMPQHWSLGSLTTDQHL
ncbi:hypothetical protein D623_10022174 [Myotis brandtii]|uniref:Uncharacterized protein n=1 Tax=Myotis brandtii TaxID=109478 RepID=S7Q972_MYOBR|nr:hypothetical protein D623_10022174 [Myotis brandtii]